MIVMSNENAISPPVNLFDASPISDYVITVLDVGRVYKPAFASFGISTPEFHLLTRIWQVDGLSQVELAELLRRDKPGITRLIDGLESKGLVRRGKHPTDRRTSTIHLTALGVERVTELTRVFGDITAEVLKDISPDEIGVLKDVSRRLRENISRYVDQRRSEGGAQHGTNGRDHQERSDGQHDEDAHHLSR